MTDKLVCEGSELCFEEVRAEKYFQKLREKQESQHEELGETTREQCEVKMLGEQYQNMLSINYILEKANQDLEPRGGFTSQASSQRVRHTHTMHRIMCLCDGAMRTLVRHTEHQTTDNNNVSQTEVKIFL